MKILVVIIFSILFTGHFALAQKLALTKGVSAVAPQGSKRLTKAEVAAFVKANFKHTEIDTNKTIVYQNNHLLISYWDIYTGPEFRRPLEKTLKLLTYLFKDDHNNIVTTSKIINVNGTRFIILEYERNDEVYLSFLSEVKPNGVNANGIIQFKKPYEAEAQKALEELLPTIKFSVQ
ncbi:hypothetical protein [uncultured Mucilaginibacter sp.]|uniref:hypothetical protein n=1 Tax=uncultured Mucilaginibacter sp. TaxID=797541 RepID=UPI002602EA94|nr:hypothetical protein [uncultured Mucilaginibacter sp.]